MPKRRRIVYEGKAKILYKGPESGTLVQHFKDDTTAFNNKKKDIIDGKGVLNNRISEYLFTELGSVGIPTHYIRTLNMREQLVREVEIIPIEVVIRNIAAGSISRRLGVKEGTVLRRPLVEFYYKSDELDDPIISEDHIAEFSWASPSEVEVMVGYALRINDFLSGLMRAVNIKLVDFKVEFGRVFEDGESVVVLADEISPDSCRLWDTTSNEKLDKDRYRNNMGGLVDAYKEVARRLGLLSEKDFSGKRPVLVKG